MDNLCWFDSFDCSGYYQMPNIKKIEGVPDHIIDFSAALHGHDYKSGVHFFIDDNKFERIWKDPYRYFPILRKYAFVFSPDFSLYTNMPIAQQIWNTYRSRMIGHMMQQYGLNVIPTISWSTSDSFSFCFDGIQSGSTVAIASTGTNRNKNNHLLFTTGFRHMIKAITPKTVIFYGLFPEDKYEGVKIIHFPACFFGKQRISYMEKK